MSLTAGVSGNSLLPYKFGNFPRIYKATGNSRSPLSSNRWSYFHYQIVWSDHLVNDPLSSLLHLPLFEAEETVLQVWPLMYTFGQWQWKLSKFGKAKEWNIRYCFTWTGAACCARAGDVWRGRGRVLLARGLNKDAAFMLFIFLSETILKWEPKFWVR